MRLPAKVLYWTCPALFCLALYWLGLKAWFQADDFAWLGIHYSVVDVPSFFQAMFSPMAQGTIRPWSERLFFLTLERTFGMDALPFRIAVFLTQFLTLALLTAVTTRITGSRLAGLLAAILWTANSSLAVAMSWTSCYNQIQCSAFLLAAFYCLLRYMETGRAVWNAAQWAIFVLGFGSLEINIVYPALATAYTLLAARKWLLKTLPLFTVSACYAVFHFSTAPKQKTGVYAMHFDSSIFQTLWDYVLWMPGILRASLAPSKRELLANTLILLSLAAFSAWQLRRRNWPALFGIAWFLITLAPLLPLRDHKTDYYLIIPTIGMAILGANALSEARKNGWLWRMAAIVPAVAYLYFSGSQARLVSAWYYHRSLPIRNLYYAVEQAHELHPKEVILLAGVDDELFWSGMSDKPFRLIENTQVYLLPGSEAKIQPHPEVANLEDQILPPEVAGRAIESGSAVVYATGGPKLINVTNAYRSQAQQWMRRPVKQIDTGLPYLNDLMGPEWYAIEGGFRWMPRRASVKIGAPSSAAEKLYLRGYYPKAEMAKGPVRVSVWLDGQPMGEQPLVLSDSDFNLTFDLPASTIGKEWLRLELEASRAVQDGAAGRELGLAFGIISIH